MINRTVGQNSVDEYDNLIKVKMGFKFRRAQPATALVSNYE